MPPLPGPRGPITDALFAALRRSPRALQSLPAPDGAHPEADEDLQLALYCCYELHYRGFGDVDEHWEWSPGLLAARASLETPFEEALLELVPPEDYKPEPGEMDLALREVVRSDDAPSV